MTRDEAERIADAWHQGGRTREGLIDALLAAVAAERERCAQITDEWTWPSCSRGARIAAREIKKAIREEPADD